MLLSPAQISDFKRDGFLHLPGAIPAAMVDTAVQSINHNIGQGVPADQLPTWRSQSWFPELAQSPAVTDLFNESGVRATLQSLMGQDNVSAAGRGQLALRFPLAPGAPVGVPHPHIDGVHSPNNGVEKGTIASFSALIGVFLTEVDTDNAGNFAVWPGSHLKMQDYFREHGTDIITHEGRTPPIERGEPLQIKAKPGDAVLAHYQLLHGIGPNHAPRPRYAVFFRVSHPDHKTHRMECLTDLWREWPGVQ